MSQKDFLDIVKENFGGRNVVKISKNDDYVLTLTFENKKNIIFSTHPLSVGICLSERSLPEKEIITILKENLCELILADCQKLKDEPIFKFVFKGFSERTLVFEGLKRCANILLLDEDSNVLSEFVAIKVLPGTFILTSITLSFTCPEFSNFKNTVVCKILG